MPFFQSPLHPTHEKTPSRTHSNMPPSQEGQEGASGTFRGVQDGPPYGSFLCLLPHALKNTAAGVAHSGTVTEPIGPLEPCGQI